MGLLDFFRGGDMTRGWLARPDLELDFNFDEFSLCGVRLGDLAELLSELGPAEDRRAARKGLLRYYSLGLEIDTRHELIESLALVWALPNVYDSVFDSFPGQCTHRGRIWPLHRETTFLDFTAHFGEPDQREVDETGMVFVYQLDAVTMEVEFDELDLLWSVGVTHRK